MAEWPTYDPDADEEGDAPELDPDYDPDAEDEEFEGQMDSILESYTPEQQQAEFNAEKEEFTAKYGFVHDCHCADDWQAGNLGMVSECYLGMMNDALDTLAAKVIELKESDREVARLRIKLADAEDPHKP